MHGSDGHKVAPDRKAILREQSLFSGLADEIIDRLCAHAIAKEIKAGATIFSKGEPGQSMFAVLQGTVKICAPSADGKDAVFNFITEGGIFGEIALLDGHPRTADAITVSRVGDVWFEVRPVVPNPTPVAVRWKAAPGYPSPAWGLDVPGWPPFPGGKAASSPAVEAWWNPDGPFPAAGTWNLPAGKSLLAVKGESVPLGDTAVTLESVTAEELAVAVLAGRMVTVHDRHIPLCRGAFKAAFRLGRDRSCAYVRR